MLPRLAKHICSRKTENSKKIFVQQLQLTTKQSGTSGIAAFFDFEIINVMVFLWFWSNNSAR